MSDFGDQRSAIERSIIGTVLLPGCGAGCQADARELGLTDQAFSCHDRRAVWRAIVDEHDDSVTVAMRLTGPPVAEVFKCVGEASIPGEYFRYRVAKLVSLSMVDRARSTAASIASNDRASVDDIVGRVRGMADGLATAAHDVSVDDSVGALLDRADSGLVGERVASLPFASSFDGFRRGRMVVVGARPKVGKSLLGLQIAVDAAKSGQPVLFASLEMSGSEQVNRLRKQVGDDGLLRSLPIDVVTHAKAPTIEAVHKLASAKKLRYGELGMVVVDYVQIARCDGESRKKDWERVSTISRECKLMAASLDCCVVALSQLKQSAESREWPRSSDLAQADALQRDADHVLLLHRPHFGSHSGDPCDTMVIHDVSRHGGTGIHPAVFSAESLGFVSARS